MILKNGDYLPNDGGDFTSTSSDGEELLQRVLFKLTARRGAFPPLPDLGSRLYLLSRGKPSARTALARQYVTEALSDETDLQIEDVLWDETTGQVTVSLQWEGESLSASVNVD